MRPSRSQEADAIREHFAAYYGVIESALLELSRRQVVRLAADSLFAQGIGHFSFATGGGPATRARLRTMLVIVLQQGRWRIRQHHFLTHADRIAAMPAQNL
ncbi:hypothetical protein DIE19_16695 [Burkholderia sp. Bp9126]|nr:hypothetical protein DIE19_16695 [Burkholderia sp. Bp9126]